MTSFIPRFQGQIFGGDIIADEEKSYRLYLSSLEGKRIEIVVGEPADERTIKQNNLYWGYIHLIAEETGNDDNELHELFKKKFLPKKESVVLGENIEYIPSTIKLGKKEFGEYLEKISILTGVPLPDLKKVAEL